MLQRYLVMGTGNACAWQNKAKLAWLGFTNMLIFESVENVGGFEPIGSAWIVVTEMLKYAVSKTRNCLNAD